MVSEPVPLRLRGAVLLLVAGILLATALAVPPAATAAVPLPPVGLGPAAGTPVDETPVLRWDRDPDAGTYEVQVATSPGFDPVLWTRTTVNTRAVPTVPLPDGDVHWRVRVTTPAGRSAWSDPATFVRAQPKFPTPVSPVGGQELQQPRQSPVFVWRAVAGASGYTVRTSPDPSFVDPTLVTTYTTTQSSYAVTAIDVPNTYYWQVRATFDGGSAGAWSPAESYELRGLRLPEPWNPTSPAYDVAQPDVVTSVIDAVLDWEPVPGAATYDLRVSTDQNFATIVDSRGGVTGTRYARPGTLDNDAYWWQVRPVDSAGRTVDWSAVPTWKFARHWPDQARLVFPEDDATIGDPVLYQWAGTRGDGSETAGVERGSQYRLELSTTRTFTSIVDTCTTTRTTYVPTGAGDCMPTAGGTFYWRVLATDGAPKTVQTAGTYDVHRFTYVPDVVTTLLPADGDTTTLPVLQWAPLPGTARYAVTVTRVDNGAVATSATTATTTLTPRTVLAPATYRWDVQALGADGSRGTTLVPLAQPTFTVVATDSTTTTATPTPLPEVPSSVGGASTRFPLLRWTPVEGANRYYVSLRSAGGLGFTRLTGSPFVYPAGEDTSATVLPPGDYEWRVEAFRDGQALAQTAAGDLGRFSITEPSDVVGHGVALTGTALWDGTVGDELSRCDASLPNACQNLRQTPVLSWEPGDEDTGYYRLYLSQNAELTNLVPGYPKTVYSTVFTPTADLPDAQAQSAYYWHVVACTSSQCAEIQTAEHAFNKLSDPVTLVGPGAPVGTTPAPRVADDVTLTWSDYLTSTQRQRPDDPLTATPLTTTPRLEADEYRVQTATDPAFANLIETVVVDQTSFTSFSNTYPEGLVYWRVQAIDRTGNNLPWSDPLVFQKRSPVPDLTGSSVEDPSTGTQRFSWEPLPYAASYDLEVYRGDGPPVDANRTLTANTRLTTYTSTKPLPFSDTPYQWRLRRVDARGRRGDWSPLTSFTVSGTAPVPVAPVAGVTVAPSDSIFTWDPVARAEAYRFERRLVGSTTAAETVVTSAFAWAPTAALAGGDWVWRVTALDTDAKALGFSESEFRVVDRPTAPDGVGISGVPQVGQLLTAVGPDWGDMAADVTTTYAWLRDNRVIAGATNSSYLLTPEDSGRAITVQATGRRPGYMTSVVTSQAVTPGAGAPLSPLSPPGISGTGRVGSVLSSSPGSWPGSPRFTYQWYRNGAVIPGATQDSYTVQAADAGGKVALLVTATLTGYQPGKAPAGPLSVARIAAQVSATLSRSTAPRSQRVTAVARVVVAGLASPRGSVTFSDGRKKLERVTLTEGSRGTATLVLPRLSPGRHSITAAYSGSSQSLPARSPKVKLVVTRR